MPDKFENATLLLRILLPSTLIRLYPHKKIRKNGTFWKRFQEWNSLITKLFCISVDGELFISSSEITSIVSFNWVTPGSNLRYPQSCQTQLAHSESTMRPPLLCELTGSPREYSEITSMEWPNWVTSGSTLRLPLWSDLTGSLPGVLRDYPYRMT